MKQKIFFLLAMLFCITLQTMAQTDDDKPENKEVDMDAPTFEPMVKVGKVLLDHDSIQYVQVNNVYVYPQPVFKNAKERMAYNRLVYNIKKVLPIAKEVRKIIIEAKLLIEEAGGKVTDFSGNDIPTGEPAEILAGNGKINEELLEIIRKDGDN